MSSISYGIIIISYDVPVSKEQGYSVISIHQTDRQLHNGDLCKGNKNLNDV